MILNINKPLGVTSYDVIRDLKRIYPHQKIGHAGTLDPLASGVLICLVGDDVKRQSEFMNVDKEYVFDVLFGVSTDTYDILGLITGKSTYNPTELEVKVREVISKYPKKVLQPVPPFSAVKVKGKPLYRWYLDGRISEVQVPFREVEVKEISIVESKVVDNIRLEAEVNSLISKVKFGFRNKSVKEGWRVFFEDNPQDKFLVVKIKAVVSKGTYVRAIANDVGESLGVKACTLSITRTRVGEYGIAASLPS